MSHLTVDLAAGDTLELVFRRMPGVPMMVFDHRGKIVVEFVNGDEVTLRSDPVGEVEVRPAGRGRDILVIALLGGVLAWVVRGLLGIV